MTVLAHARPGALKVVHGPRASRRIDIITLVLAMWMNIGGQVDGWAHGHYNLETEGIFTPWHALFYSGFVACGAWVCWQVIRTRDDRRVTVPAGYGLGLVGLGIFAVGAVGDLTWHTIFGIEQDVAALLSPTHLMLLVGSMLIESIPLRAAWAARDERDSTSLRTFLVPLLSLSLLVVDASFFLSYFSAFANLAPTISGTSELHGIGSALITNVVLLVPTLLLLRRWHPPFGAITVLFGVVAVLTSGLTGFVTGVTIVPALLGGLATDIAIRRLRPSPAQPGTWTAFSMLAPAALWSAYYLTLQLSSGLVWDVELAPGLVVLNSLVGFALALLVAGCSERLADGATVRTAELSEPSSRTSAH
jgi:hypothetical protein